MFGRLYGPAVMMSSCLDESTAIETVVQGIAGTLARDERGGEDGTPQEHERTPRRGHAYCPEPAMPLRVTRAEHLRAGGQCQEAVNREERREREGKRLGRSRGGATVAWPRLSVLCSLFSILLALPCPASAQRLFPPVPSFELPEASPRVHGLVGRLLSARLGDSDFGKEPEAEVGLGENSRCFRSPAQDLGRSRSASGRRSTGRFSLVDSKSALISNDWVVGVNTTAELGHWSLTGEIIHESSHLGDEYRDRFGATRIDWTREVASGWVSYSTGPWRAIGSLSYVLIDQLDLDRPGAVLALDYRQRQGGRLPRCRSEAGWGDLLRRRGCDCLACEHLRQGRGGLRHSDSVRQIGFAVVGHTGLSTQRQFFRRESRYVGAELRFDL